MAEAPAADKSAIEAKLKEVGAKLKEISKGFEKDEAIAAAKAKESAADKAFKALAESDAYA